MSEAGESSGPSNYQRQTILNLYYSGIPPEIIAVQMDLDQPAIDEVIQQAAWEEEQREAARQESEMSSLASLST
jgi:hypothetical protein